MSLLTRTDQKFLSFALSSLWKFMPGLAGLSCKSNAVVLTAFCSSEVRRARLSVKVSAMRNSTVTGPQDYGVRFGPAWIGGMNPHRPREVPVNRMTVGESGKPSA